MIAWLPIVRVDKIVNTNGSSVQAIKAAFWAFWQVPDQSRAGLDFLFARRAGLGYRWRRLPVWRNW